MKNQKEHKLGNNDAFNWALGAYSLTESVGYYTENMAKHLRGRAAFAVVARELGYIKPVAGTKYNRSGWVDGVPTMDQAKNIFAAYEVYMDKVEARKKERLNQGFKTAMQARLADIQEAVSEIGTDDEADDSICADEFDSLVNPPIQPDLALAPTISQLLTSIDVKLGRMLELWEPSPDKVPVVRSLKEIDRLIESASN